MFKPEDSVQKSGVCGLICAGSLTLLEDNRSVATVKCPLCNSIFNKSEYLGRACETCGLCKLGEDVLGLNIQLESDLQTMQPGPISNSGNMMMQTALDGESLGSNDLFL